MAQESRERSRAPAPDPPLTLGDPLDRVHGIGPRWAKQLREIGIGAVGDLLERVPFRYEDRRRLAPLAEAREGAAITAVGLIRQSAVIRTRGRGMEILTVLLDDGTAALPVRFFGRGYLLQYMKAGERLLVHGTPRRGRQGLELAGPDFELLPAGADPNTNAGWIPVYEKLGPLTPRKLRTIVQHALEQLGSIDEVMPLQILQHRRLPSRGTALRWVHAPPLETPADEITSRRSPGHRRLAFDEFFLLELGLAVRKQRRKAERRIGGYQVDEELLQRLSGRLPFKLTGAQQRTMREIVADLAEPSPMNRLLLGDVGSGKTAVAALTMLAAIENGLQAALMAPTEILAAQHARNLQQLLLPFGQRVDLLTASLPASQAASTRERIASGQATMIVGTHALLGDKVSFAKLGLTVIDEQHRFGVVQRADLVAKGGHPDVLVMSATPIPRTLAMVMYGDLDVSVLDQKPPGRQPIKTLVRTAAQREQVLQGVAKALAEKRQIYIVRPAVEEGPKGVRAAEEGAREYAERFPQASLALVHGKLRATERQANLDAFRGGRAQILMATTVIEVGIDVPSASVIVVEDAEHFGLAQLHQLRGRVGRGELKSYCVLIASENASPQALERLQVLSATDDGFRVAEKDLELRGPGEFAGTAQSGLPTFAVADLVRHGDLLIAAREDAFQWVQAQGERGIPEALWKEVLRRHGERLRLAETG
ncbi:MAG: ATP-dependent DNA helicase RecG [Acidobacteriota bacterium]